MRRAVLVVGLPRSGTSLACQALQRLGVDFGGPLIPGDSANPHGYEEHQELTNRLALLVVKCCKPPRLFHDGPLEMRSILGDRLDLLNVLKDQPDFFGWKVPFAPRLPVFFTNLLSEAGYHDVTYIHALRWPMPAYRSMMKANGASAEADTDPQRKMYMRVWARYLIEAKALTPEPREIWFDEWFHDAQRVFDKIADAVKLPRQEADGLLMKGEGHAATPVAVR